MADTTFFTEQELKDIQIAKDIEVQVQKLGDQCDALLDPICKRILALPVDQLKEKLPTLIEAFPSGFHRSELRTIMHQLGV